MSKELLMVPGPTPIPPEVARAMSTEMFNHRGPRFKNLQAELIQGLKKIFQTEGRLFILTASGTGAMEAAVVNFLSPGDKVLALVNGSFGDRMAKIAAAFDADVERMQVEAGKPFDYGAIEDKLKADRDGRIKAITVVHNESSTGMMNDIEAISKMRNGHPALLIVDTVSSMGAVDIPVDNWNIDVCLTGSQKALMLPPGLSIISVGERAWQAAGQSRMKKYYFNLLEAQRYAEQGQTPFTPAISQMVAMQRAMELYFREGRQAVYDRHRRMALAARAAMRALGLELLVDDRFASMTVTAVKKPGNIDIAELRSLLRERCGVEIAGGHGDLSGQIFRLGHLGYIQETDVLAAVAALEIALSWLGFPVQKGAGVQAAQEAVFNS